jgi:succinate dehydrogenase/fumarate reductase flavoprotein subunit
VAGSGRRPVPQADPGTGHDGGGAVARAELANLATVGRVVGAAALAREETRGAHSREDFPDRSTSLRVRFVTGG